MSFVQRTSTTLRNVPKVTAGKRLLQSTASKASDDGNLKPFTDIPGPKALPKLGNWWRYLLGEYSMDRLHRSGLKKYGQFGPIVREEIVPGVNLLLLYTPQDIERMYQLEGPFPSRRSHCALEFYRLSKPDVYNNGGLLPTNGPEWQRQRMLLQRPLSLPENICIYIAGIDDIACELVDTMTTSSADSCSEPADFLEQLSRVFAEFLGLVTFDTRLGALRPDLSSQSLPMRLIQSATDTNRQILQLDNGLLQLWRRWKTPAYKVLYDAQQYIETVALDFVNAKKRAMEDQQSADCNKQTLLGMYLSSEQLDTKDVVTVVSDMLLAGIETSAYTMSFILYHLATNSAKQEKLYREIQEVLPGGQLAVDAAALANLKYLKAAVKEAMRLNPVSIGVGRILPEDGSFSGYSVPKDTILVSQNQVSSRLECYFENPHDFIPERWIKGNAAYKKYHPYLVLPFGHGPRACIARRLAEQNIYILLTRLVQRFEIVWIGSPDLDCQSHLINRPDKPLQFRFVQRSA